jgi:hypothetical protein
MRVEPEIDRDGRQALQRLSDSMNKVGVGNATSLGRAPSLSISHPAHSVASVPSYCSPYPDSC